MGPGPSVIESCRDKYLNPGRHFVCLLCNTHQGQETSRRFAAWTASAFSIFFRKSAIRRNNSALSNSNAVTVSESAFLFSNRKRRSENDNPQQHTQTMLRNNSNCHTDLIKLNQFALSFQYPQTIGPI
jgi:hypothetical protein